MMLFSRRFAFLALPLAFTFQSAWAQPSQCQALFKDASVQAHARWTGTLAKRPRVIIVSAPSGGGKTTLINKLLAEYPDDFEVAVATTTRPPRPLPTGEMETNGRDYFFTTVPEIKARIANGEFLEFAEVHGNYYGTARGPVEAALKAGKSVILNIDVQGTDKVRQAMPQADYLDIFIAPPSMQVLESRLRGRGTDPEEAIQKRLKNAYEEMKQQPKYKASVVNDNLETAYADLKTVLQNAAP